MRLKKKYRNLLKFMAEKCRIEECILVNKMGLIRENLSKAAIILAIDFLSAVYILAGTMRYYRMKNIVDYDFYLYTFKVIAVYVFLLLIVAMFLGMLAAQASKRLTGICLLIMFYFVFSDTFMQFILSLFSDNPGGARFGRFCAHDAVLLLPVAP